jgi:GAF domain-containing protein
MDSPETLLTAIDLAALVECGRELSAEIDWPDLVRRILDKAGALTDSPDTSIILYNHRRDSLYFAGATGDTAAFLLQTFGETCREQLSMDSLAGEVFRTGRSQLINQVADDPRHSKVVDGTTKKTTRAMVCVPLSAGGERLGVVQLLNKRSGPYTERDRVLLEHFAEQAAVAIRNARLVEDLVGQMGWKRSSRPPRVPLSSSEKMG